MLQASWAEVISYSSNKTHQTWCTDFKPISLHMDFLLCCYSSFTCIAGPEKRPHIPHKVVDQAFSLFRIEFTTVEVGSYVVDVLAGGLSVPGSPLIAKAYDAGLIKVTDILDGVVGEMSTFRGEGKDGTILLKCVSTTIVCNGTA